MDASTQFLINLSNKTCRTCLQEHEATNSWHDMVQCDEQQMELKELLSLVTRIKLSAVETYAPKRICDECTEKLFIAFEFIRGVEKSEQLLEEHLKSELVLDQYSMPIVKEDEDNVQIEEVAANEEQVETELQQIEIIEQGFEVLHTHEEQQHAQPTEILGVNEDNMFVKEEQCEISSVGSIGDNIQQRSDVESEEEFLFCETNNDTTEIVEECIEETYEQKLMEKPKRHRKPLAIGSRLARMGYCKEHKCDKCERTFAKEETLKNHIALAHPQLAPELVVDMSKTLPCPHCPRTFARQNNLERHIRIVHAEDVTAEQGEQRTADEQDNASNKPQKYKRGLCPHCGESFSLASLVIHIRRHTGDYPYKCQHCEKAFPRRQDLLIHERQHTGERPYVCYVCTKSFIRPNKLTRHMRIHTGQRPYKCTECDRGFSQSNDLKIHMRRHTGEKPFVCGICGEGFICGSKLKIHRKLKSHFEPEVDEVDPYANCRVNNRLGKTTTQSMNENDMTDDY